jgi:TetR/AcrR family transcriptional regulator
MKATRRRIERRNPEATRRALLQASAELFAESGYDGVRVEALARRAGVNKAMINYHFGGKRKLYETVIASVFDELGSRVDALAASPRPAGELLGEFVAGFTELAGRHQSGFPALVLREIIASHGSPPWFVPRVMKIFLGLRGIISRGIREGEFRAVDPAVVYMNLIGGLVFFLATEPVRHRVFKAQRLGAPPTIEAYVRYVQELLHRGLERPGRSRTPRGASA